LDENTDSQVYFVKLNTRDKPVSNGDFVLDRDKDKTFEVFTPRIYLILLLNLGSF
jgi:hypothetical protein